MQHPLRIVLPLWLLALTAAIFAHSGVSDQPTTAVLDADQGATLRAGGATDPSAPARPVSTRRPAMVTPAALEARFSTDVASFVKTYCLECHSGDKPEAELDLSTLTSRTAAADEPRWGLILEMLENGEMPADDAKVQPTPQARSRAVAWFKDLRTYEVARNAGDPGVVLARRLSNAEYNYTIRDLTGVDLPPAREFPADPSNPAGFDNSGESLTMSPALLKKYLAAARDVANHAYLNADGLHFAPHTMLADVDRRQAVRPPDHRLLPPAQHELYGLLRGRLALQAPRRAAAGRGRRWPRSPRTPRSARSTSPRSGTCSKARGRRSARWPASRRVWRALPPPGPTGEDTAAGGREALRGYIETLRAKIEPRFRNLVAPGVNAAQQPFMIWQNVQYATHRMTFDPAQLQVEGEPAPAPVRRRGAGRQPVRARPDAARSSMPPAIPIWSCRRASAPPTRQRSPGSAASSRTCSTCRSAAGTTSIGPRIAAAISTPASTA